MQRFALKALFGLALLALTSAVPIVVSRAMAAPPPARSHQTDTRASANTSYSHFSGVIVSLNGARYILRDYVNGTWYHLDDQRLAGQYQGKEVSVTSTLEGRYDMIHVHSIHPSKS